jgi:YVTN family beta-propeller protein
MNHGTTKTLNVAFILLLIFLFCTLALLPQRARAETPTATINVGTHPLGVAITPDGSTAYVANEGSGTVSVINTATNIVTGLVSVGSDPWGVAVTPNGAYAYVTNFGSNTVSVISTATNAVTTSITVGNNPYDVAITPNGNYAYITNSGSNWVTVINTATKTLTSVNVGSFSNGVAITPDGNYAYVTSAASNTVWVISTATNMLTATITGLSHPYNVATTPNSAFAFVTNEGSSNTVWVVSTATNTVTPPVTGLSSPWGVAVTPNGAYAYVANSGSDTISVINVLVASNAMSSPSTVDQGQISSLTSTPVTTGTPSYAYQWFAEAPGAGSYSAIGGANSPNYPFSTDSSTGIGTWSFELEVIDSSDERLNSSAISVTVNAAPSVTVAPGTATLDVGQSTTFTASASGGSDNYTSYLWYLDGIAQSGQTASTFSYWPALSGTHSITAVVTDSLGATSNQSAAASAIVSASPTVSIAPFGSLTMDAGQSQTFTAISSGGSGTIHYQWYLGDFAVSGATASTYTFNDSAGSYSVTCETTDSASTPVTSPASNAVSVAVNSALVAPTASASAGTVDQGQTSNLTSNIASTGTSPYSYQWLEKAPGASSYSSISGATSPSYSFATSDSTSTGTWSFELQEMDNVEANVTSSAASVMVNADPSVSVSPETAALNVGQSQLFTASPNGGSGSYSSYQWYINGAAQSGETASTFSYSPTSAGTYSVTVTVTDSSGETSTQSTAVTVTFSATATPTPPPTPTPTPTPTPAIPTATPNRTTPTPTIPTVTPTRTTSPSSTPTPKKTPLPSQNPTTSPNKNQSQILHQETIYEIAAAVAILAVAVGLVTLRKGRKEKV